MEELKIYKYDYTNFDTTLVQKHLFDKYSAGKYTDLNVIKGVFKLLFDVYSQELDQLIIKYWWMELLDITLSQHNKSVILQKEWGGVWIVTGAHPIVWKQMYKYILELIIKHHKILPKSTEITERIINQIFCLTDEIFRLANAIANLRFYAAWWWIELIPKNKIWTTFMNYWNDPAFSYRFYDKASRGMELYTTKYNDCFSQYNKELQYPLLNDIFLSNHWFTYEKYLSTCITFCHESSLSLFPDTYLWNKYIKEQDLIEILKSWWLKNKEIDLIISSISLNNENIESREIYKPDADYRFYARFLTKTEYEWDVVYFWDPLLAKESFWMIIGNFMVWKIPNELHNTEINNAVQKLRNKHNKSFEELISNQLEKTRYSGKRWKENEFFNNEVPLILPSEIWEIDRIGLDPNKQNIMVYEFKTNKLAAVDIQFANEIQKFTEYWDKFVKKINWIKANFEEIKEWLCKTNSLKSKNMWLEAFMITEKPTAYAYFEKRFFVENFCEMFEKL